MATATRRILVVEDDATNLVLLRAVLARATEPVLRDAVVTEVGTLGGARDAIAADAYDLILLDVRLPDGDGLDLARGIRASAPDSQPRILILSASVLAAEREAAIAAGGDQFLAKPYHPTDLLTACTGLMAS